mgnify:CR=1 FL=1
MPKSGRGDNHLLIYQETQNDYRFLSGSTVPFFRGL